MLSELRKASESGVIFTYHFNILRSILEKTATFFGKEDFSECIKGIKDEGLYSRALNLLSHGKYSLYEPVEMLEDNKQLFRDILSAFLEKYEFDLPALLNTPAADGTPVAAPSHETPTVDTSTIASEPMLQATTALPEFSQSAEDSTSAITN
jgi:hypothetical protein